MRLVDAVVQAAAANRLKVFGRPGMTMEAPSIAGLVQDCTVRYALDRAASEQCTELVYASAGLPDLDDPITRPPHYRFWIELFASGVDTDGRDRAGAGPRFGYLVDCQPGGRAGRIICFVENEDLTVSILGGQVIFDHRRAHAGPEPRPNAVRMRHPAAPGIERTRPRPAGPAPGLRPVCRTLSTIQEKILACLLPCRGRGVPDRKAGDLR